MSDSHDVRCDCAQTVHCQTGECANHNKRSSRIPGRGVERHGQPCQHVCYEHGHGKRLQTEPGSDVFSIGVDLNQAMGHDNGAYDLIRFTMSVNGTVVSSTSSNWTLFPINPGNGYSDASIVGFDPSDLAPTDKIVFATTFGRATAGREQYFLQRAAASASPVPEPASMILVGTGLAGAAAAYRRKRMPKA